MRDHDKKKSGDVISLLSRKNRDLDDLSKLDSKEATEEESQSLTDCEGGYFDLIVKKNEEKKRKIEEERTRNNKTVLHSYRIK